ncbi:MAG: hypothetical protein M3081_05090, partial [Gemmatimonadota bacterium]|nr:hypothetical protein [Gemmatimonadota bacterium]
MPIDLNVSSQLMFALIPDLIVMGGAMLLLIYSVSGSSRDTIEHSRRVALGAVIVCVAAAASIIWM